MQKTLALVISLFILLVVVMTTTAQTETDVPVTSETVTAEATVTPSPTPDYQAQALQRDNDLNYDASNWIAPKVLKHCNFALGASPTLLAKYLVVVPSSSTSMGGWMQYSMDLALYNAGLTFQDGQCYLPTQVEVPDQPEGIGTWMILVMGDQNFEATATPTP